MLHAAGDHRRRGPAGSGLDRLRVEPGRLFVAIAGEDLPASSTASVRFWVTDTEGSRVFRGQGGRLSCSAIRPAEDGLRLVHADAGGAELPASRRTAADPVGSDQPGGHRTPRTHRHGGSGCATGHRPPRGQLLGLPVGSGRPAAVRRPGRRARAPQRPGRREGRRLPGRRRQYRARRMARDCRQDHRWPVVHGNHAFAAIPVPEGDHRVELVYRAPGLRVGVVVTVASLLVAAVPVIGPVLVRRRRQAPGARQT